MPHSLREISAHGYPPLRGKYCLCYYDGRSSRIQLDHVAATGSRERPNTSWAVRLQKLAPSDQLSSRVLPPKGSMSFEVASWLKDQTKYELSGCVLHSNCNTEYLWSLSKFPQICNFCKMSSFKIFY